MSKTQHHHPANSGSNVARGMILGGTAKSGGPMKDRRNKRQGNRSQQERRACQEHSES